MKSLPIKLKIYLYFLYLSTPIAIYILTKSNFVPKHQSTPFQIIFFAILVAITESYGVEYRNFSFTSTFGITFASFILFGPISAIIILCLGFSFRVLKIQGRYVHLLNTPFYKTLFNLCIFTLSIINSYFLHSIVDDTFGNYWLSQISFAIGFFMFNSLFIAILKSIITHRPIHVINVENFRLCALNILLMTPFGIMLSFIYEEDILGVILVLFPILLARYIFILYIEVKSRYIQTVDVLMRTMEARDKYTEGHSHRVANIVSMIARELKYSESKIEVLNIASLLHDVGKIGIDDSILNKPSKLSNEEYEVIKRHPEIGYNILKDIKDFKDIALLVKHHHERYDGKGYPEGKNATELSFDTFIIQLADSVDAMASDRPYRGALSRDEIIAELLNNRGTQFHPVIVDAYISALSKNK